jgi:predicted nucleotide-binding protein
MPQTIQQALEDFADAAEDVLVATYDTFGDAARRLGDVLDPWATLGHLADESLPSVNFQEWYDAQAATQGSFVGSAKLDWPRDPKERLAIQLALFRSLGSGAIDVLDFCLTFLWAGNRNDANVRNFVEQMARPFLRDFERHIRRLAEADHIASSTPIGVNIDIANSSNDQPLADARKIFVVYGRDENLRRSMFDFLRAIGLIPMEWSQAIAITGKGAPYVGEVISTAFQVAQAILVLLSPDDEVRLTQELCGAAEDSIETSLQLQPRPNVLFEAGMAFGSKPDRTILVEIGAVKRFSDVAGRHALRLNNTSERRLELVNRLQSAGCHVDVVGTDWLSIGDFEITRGKLPSPSAVDGPPSSPSVKYVDINYPDDAGILGRFKAEGREIRWCSDEKLARALDLDGWQLVRLMGDDGRDFVLKLHDRPFEQTLVSRPVSTT